MVNLDKLFGWNDKIYIFGASSRAKTLMGYLSLLYPSVSVKAYLVDDDEDNGQFIKNVPVLQLDSGINVNTDLPVFIATKGMYHEEKTGKLAGLGFTEVIPVDVELDNALRNAYVKTVFGRENRPFVKLVELGDKGGARIYMAKSVYDKPLETGYVCPYYETPIQVGAALTDKRLEDCKYTDCEGDNISDRNRQYSELTGLYWIWKHTAEEIVGLSHYRRHFILPENWAGVMAANGIDVVLPVPTYVYPSVTGNYIERHDAGDWQFLLEYIKKNCTKDFVNAIDEVYNGNLYFPCNMFIMRRGILDGLCSWMFPILDAVVEHGGVKEDAYLNRYPGFISERLITLYFYVHRKEYSIAYADRRFVS